MSCYTQDISMEQCNFCPFVWEFHYGKTLRPGLVAVTALPIPMEMSFEGGLQNTCNMSSRSQTLLGQTAVYIADLSTTYAHSSSIFNACIGERWLTQTQKLYSSGKMEAVGSTSRSPLQCGNCRGWRFRSLLDDFNSLVGLLFFLWLLIR